MGSGPPPGDERPVVAAFDLDGTLAYRGSVARFAWRAVGVRSAMAAALAGLRSAIGRPGGRRRFKEAGLRSLLAGRTTEAIEEAGRQYAARILRSHLQPPILRHLRDHRAAGHHLVLLTAALDVYAVPLGQNLGFDAVLATEACTRAGRCTGSVRFLDNSGHAKVERLTEHLHAMGIDPASVVLHAYGGHRDRPVLEWARRTATPR
jgi:HAD superfamily phosphoserine phosphatase-like hydrolase